MVGGSDPRLDRAAVDRASRPRDERLGAPDDEIRPRQWLGRGVRPQARCAVQSAIEVAYEQRAVDRVAGEEKMVVGHASRVEEPFAFVERGRSFSGVVRAQREAAQDRGAEETDARRAAQTERLAQHGGSRVSLAGKPLDRRKEPK